MCFFPCILLFCFFSPFSYRSCVNHLDQRETGPSRLKICIRCILNDRGRGRFCGMGFQIIVKSAMRLNNEAGCESSCKEFPNHYMHAERSSHTCYLTACGQTRSTDRSMIMQNTHQQHHQMSGSDQLTEGSRVRFVAY